ncbi:MAG: alpha/beta hydrolase [Mogibacterium sp.]|nr:alpha/beta hydrolase [Mogibacterium sp.]
MGYLGSHLDSSARSNWIEELVNTLAQLAVLAGVIIVYFGTYYHADITASEALNGTEDVEVCEITEEKDGSDGWLFDGPGTDSVLVFYPGAKVEAAAYAPLMNNISEHGTDCYLCKMPLNFALFGKDAAEAIRSGAALNYDKWYIGGHSLGGAAAAMTADNAESADGEEAWDGLILFAAYPTCEISTPVLSIYGSEDGVLNTEKYNKAGNDGLWPADFTETVIEGGNHAQFGNYGEQKGDCSAGISADRQQKQTAEAVNYWIKEE